VQDLVEETLGALVPGILEEVFKGADLDYAALVHRKVDVLEDLKVAEVLVAEFTPPTTLRGRITE
jgi:hypothetical protein